MEATRSDVQEFGETYRRLVRLCLRLTGDRDAAEDLAQDTLAEAWRLRRKLRDESARDPWLAAIARNLCLRWLRQRGRARAHLAASSRDDFGGEPPSLLTDPADFTVELERHELADLLDRALALLPPATARVLVARYIGEVPHAEIAARLGISPDAVAMRLARGRRQVRQLLEGELREPAAPYGLARPALSRWHETRIWCPGCGGRRLEGRFERPGGVLAFRCPTCHPEQDGLLAAFRLDNAHFGRLLVGVGHFKPAYSRTLAWVHAYYRRGLAEGMVACTRCGRLTPLVRALGACDEAPLGPWPRLVVRCAACGERGSTSLGGLVQALPIVRRFWRRHPRLRILPPRAVHAAGRPAFVVRVASVTDGAYLDVVSARDTCAVLAVHGTAAATGAAVDGA